MKRKFGKKLIEEFFPRVDLTHVIDTSGAYIPGHGTPTVILIARNRKPVTSKLRTVMRIRGEPSTPEDPARGLVWAAILAQLDQSGSEGDFVSVCDSLRELFHKHPWSIGGGGAAELKDLLDSCAEMKLDNVLVSIGPASFAGLDEAFVAPLGTFRRSAVEKSVIRLFAGGDQLRDWQSETDEECITPYGKDAEPLPLDETSGWARWLWPLRRTLETVTSFGGKTRAELGEQWWTWYRWIADRVRANPRIAFAFVATHNHFVIDRGKFAFNRSAPVIRLSSDEDDDTHFALLGLLNSSTAGFLMKQVMQPKQMTAGDGVRIESIAKVPHEFSATQMGNLPLPPDWAVNPLCPRIAGLAREIDHLANRLTDSCPGKAIVAALGERRRLRDVINEYTHERSNLRGRLILLQEELDFVVYAAYGLATVDLLGNDMLANYDQVGPGDRPFCMVRQSNQEGFDVPTAIPTNWPIEIQSLWRHRIDAIKEDAQLRVIEDPHYKRRWIGRQGKYNHVHNADEGAVACTAWLLDRLESYSDFDGRMNDEGKPTARLDIALTTVGKLADTARRDPDFLQVGELYRDDPAFDVTRLVAELVEGASVPLLPILRYKPSGLRKREEWENTWTLQRQEDLMSSQQSALSDQLRDAKDDGEKAKIRTRIETLTAESRKLTASITVPPKYTSADFVKSDYWRLRGKLDVPKERWVCFPHCEGEDGTLMVAWAGYDHLQLARAISAYYVDVQERLGGREDPRLVPLLACLIELLPWLKQWHNEVDPEFGVPMGDYFEGFLQEESRNLGLTLDEIKRWKPPERSRGRSPTKPKRKTNVE